MIGRTTVKSVSESLHRTLLLIFVIVLGILFSSQAEAASRSNRGPYPGTLRKKDHSYSCEALMKKQRGTGNKIVKVKGRRPKWR